MVTSQLASLLLYSFINLLTNILYLSAFCYNKEDYSLKGLTVMPKSIQHIIQNYKAKPYGQQRLYAVLLPLIEVKDELHVLYEVRSHLISQPGDTSFPGGGVEEGESFEAAAVRETTEELNIGADDIEVYGAIDYVVNDRAIIYCFVGKINRPLDSFQVNEEVERLFTVPLAFLMENEPKYYTIQSKALYDEEFPFHLINNGRDYKFSHMKHHTPFYSLPEETLWGYTANLTHRFTSILKEQEFKLE